MNALKLLPGWQWLLPPQEFILWYFPTAEISKKYDIQKVRKYEGTNGECIEKRRELMERLKVKKDCFVIELKTD